MKSKTSSSVGLIPNRTSSCFLGILAHLTAGLPEEVTLTRAIHPLFGVSDKTLGKHVERAYYALALDEDELARN